MLAGWVRLTSPAKPAPMRKAKATSCGFMRVGFFLLFSCLDGLAYASWYLSRKRLFRSPMDWTPCFFGAPGPLESCTPEPIDRVLFAVRFIAAAARKTVRTASQVIFLVSSFLPARTVLIISRVSAFSYALS